MARTIGKLESAPERHTPGPWHWQAARTMRHLTANGSAFAQCSMPTDPCFDADARLIAAAPNMAEALSTLIYTDDLQKAIDQARAALASAGVKRQLWQEQ